MSLLIAAVRKPAQILRLRTPSHWLTLAATPVFGLMAWVTLLDAAPVTMCVSASHLLPIDPMAWMYLLMSLFHAPPWLQLAVRSSLVSEIADHRQGNER